MLGTLSKGQWVDRLSRGEGTDSDIDLLGTLSKGQWVDRLGRGEGTDSDIDPFTDLSIAEGSDLEVLVTLGI